MKVSNKHFTCCWDLISLISTPTVVCREIELALEAARYHVIPATTSTPYAPTRLHKSAAQTAPTPDSSVPTASICRVTHQGVPIIVAMQRHDAVSVNTPRRPLDQVIVEGWLNRHRRSVRRGHGDVVARILLQEWHECASSHRDKSAALRSRLLHHSLEHAAGSAIMQKFSLRWTFYLTRRGYHTTAAHLNRCSLHQWFSVRCRPIEYRAMMP